MENIFNKLYSGQKVKYYDYNNRVVEAEYKNSGLYIRDMDGKLLSSLSYDRLKLLNFANAIKDYLA